MHIGKAPESRSWLVHGVKKAWSHSLNLVFLAADLRHFNATSSLSRLLKFSPLERQLRSKHEKALIWTSSSFCLFILKRVPGIHVLSLDMREQCSKRKHLLVHKKNSLQIRWKDKFWWLVWRSYVLDVLKINSIIVLHWPPTDLPPILKDCRSESIDPSSTFANQGCRFFKLFPKNFQVEAKLLLFHFMTSIETV